ncbi:PREDICTED: translation initiation factor IF-2-like [Rhinopithecus bieti]|uniref:translation initiation factor IF-2-like n=1 Tax=Rhinopithecus bieti TaxID=61621 RepID=UPI00083BB17F|nr:PREDICTED: translation initiation factor IF-2-like [Rhinopithecus bieti]
MNLSHTKRGGWAQGAELGQPSGPGWEVGTGPALGTRLAVWPPRTSLQRRVPAPWEEALSRAARGTSPGSARHWGDRRARRSRRPGPRARDLLPQAPPRQGREPGEGESWAAPEPRDHWKNLQQRHSCSGRRPGPKEDLELPPPPRPAPTHHPRLQGGATGAAHSEAGELGTSTNPAPSELVEQELPGCSCSHPAAAVDISVLSEAQQSPLPTAGSRVPAPAAWLLSTVSTRSVLRARSGRACVLSQPR